MRKYLPIVLSVIVVAFLFTMVKSRKIQHQSDQQIQQIFPGTFSRKQGCGRPPRFLRQLKIKQPVIIDLSQRQYTGIAFQHGDRMQNVLHSQQWEHYGSFGTYAIDEQGNLYLAPMPHISIEAETFERQKNIYKLDSMTGQLSVFMRLTDVAPGPENPYGVYTLAYDCEDKTLWVATIDETDYYSQKGVIYHIDPKTKTNLQRVQGFDATTLKVLFTARGKYLLAGSASDSGLYAFTISAGELASTPVKLLELPDTNAHVRKIKINSGNRLELQVIPFSYTLITQSTKNYREIYEARWDDTQTQWVLTKKQ